MSDNNEPAAAGANEDAVEAAAAVPVIVEEPAATAATDEPLEEGFEGDGEATNASPAPAVAQAEATSAEAAVVDAPQAAPPPAEVAQVASTNAEADAPQAAPPASEEPPSDAVRTEDPSLKGAEASAEGVPPTEPVADALDREIQSREGNRMESNLSEVAGMPDALHIAAQAGQTPSVQMLLRNKADPSVLNSEGRTALELAEAKGHAEVSEILRKVSPPPRSSTMTSTDQDILAKVLIDEQASTGLTATNEATARPLASSGMQDTIPGQPARKQPSKQHDFLAMSTSAMTNLPANNGSSVHDPLMPTTEGVLKRTTYMTSVSRYQASPKWTLRPRGPSALLRSTSTPAPGTYDLCAPGKNKFKTEPKFSFGSSSRFTAEPHPAKRNPGPGNYNPADPNLANDTKVGFGSSIRGKVSSAAYSNPGPGAYEMKSNVGAGLMFTARGRAPGAYMIRSWSQPGPGAYSPAAEQSAQSAPKCGFGTSSRDAEATRAARTNFSPGPGTYEMGQHRAIGRDASKYSATSRRRVHDLNSYLSPGPGAYNSHITSFGY